MAFEPDLLSRSMPDAPPPPEQQGGSLLGDAAKAFTAGVVDTTAQGVGLLNQDPNSDPSKLRDVLNEVTAVIDKTISPKSQRAEGAQFVPSEGEAPITEAPFRSAVMKGARMSPMLLASMLLPSGWAGVAAGSALFGTQGVAQQLNESHKKIMTMPEDELLDKSSLYRGLRNDNDEATARAKLIDASNDTASLLFAGGSNAAAGGALAHALKAQAAKGIVKSTLVGAGDAALGGAIMGGGTSVAQQHADTNIGLQDDIDPGKAALAALNASLTNAPLGAAFGAYSGMGQRRATRGAAQEARDKAKGTTIDENGPTPGQEQAINESLNTPSDSGTSPPSEPTPPPSNSSSGATGAPAAAPVPGKELSLSQRIAAEEARQAAEAAKATQAPPVAPAAETPVVQPTPSPAPTPTPTPTPTPPVISSRVTEGARLLGKNDTGEDVYQRPDGLLVAIDRTGHPFMGPKEEGRWQVIAPTSVTPVGTGPLKAAEVQAVAAAIPKKARPPNAVPKEPVEPPASLLPVQKTAAHPNSLRGRIEQEEAAAAKPAAKPAEVKPAEPEAATPKEEPLAALADTATPPIVPRETASAEDIAAYAPKAASKPVVVEKRTPRVLRKPVDVEAEAAKAKVQAEKKSELDRRISDAARKRVARLEEKAMPNEVKARNVVEEHQPKQGSDDLEFRAGTEDLAMSRAEGGSAAAVDNARSVLLADANRLVAAAENTGIKIPSRTIHSIELQGEKNPTPFTSRLTELVKFDKLVKAAQRLEDPAVREKRVAELFQQHVITERALRAGDLEGAAARRLAANEARDAKAELAKLKREQQADAKNEAANSRKSDAERTEEVADESGSADDVVEQGSRTRKGKADHYHVEPGEVRHSTVHAEAEQLIHEFSQVQAPKSRERAQLLIQILRKLQKVGGTTEMHFTSDPNQMPAIMGRLGFGGVFNRFSGQTLAEGVRGDIWIDNREVAGGGVQGPRLIIHEAAHAAMAHAIDADSKLRRDIERLMEEVGPEVQKHTFDDMTNPHEFMSEVMANPRVQDVLLNKPAPAWVLKEWGLEPQSMWRALVSRITKALGLGEKHVTLMDAALHLGDRAMAYDPPVSHFSRAQLDDSIARNEYREQSGSIASRAAEVRDDLRAAAPHIPGTIRNRVRGALQKVMFFDTIAQNAREYFGGDAPTQLSREVARMAREKEHIERERFEPVQRSGADLERKFPEQFRATADFLIDETSAGVFADKPLKGQKNLTAQNRAAHGELETRYNALPQDMKDFRRQLHDTLRDAQNEASLATMKNIVYALNEGVPKAESDALAQRIFDKTTTEAEKKVLSSDGVMKAIRNAGALSKLSGPYVFAMRHGDHVVSGEYRIDTPAGAERYSSDGVLDPKGDVFSFKTKAEADKFSASVPAKVTSERKVYTDPATGSRYGVDSDGTKVRLTKEDWAANTADERFHVRVQPRLFEKFESEVTARQRHAELTTAVRSSDGQRLFELDGVTPSHWEPTGKNATFVSHEFDRMLNSLRQREGFRKMTPEQRASIETQLREASLAALGPTRLQKHRIGRNYTAGASTDINKGLNKYASSMAGFLSRQKHRPEIDRLMKQLTDYEQAHRYEDTSRTYPRGQMLKELQGRVYAQGESESFSLFTRGVNRLLQISMLDKLASSAYHVISSMEPWTVSMPILAGRHGVGKAMAALNQAYNDIGARGVLKEGALNTGRALRSNMRDTDYLKPMSDRLKRLGDGKHLQEVLKEMQEIGLISHDAGMEFRRMTDPSANPLLRGIDRMDLMARQMGTAVESINRAVTGLAAYRLEFGRTKDHAASKAYAIETVMNTMGDYGGWNAPALFNHPIGRIAFQFKKYAAKTYTLLGLTAVRALKGDREAMKQFAGLMATHGLLAGALGLPLEAVKAGFIAAGMLGATSSNYGDFEQWMRKQAAAAGGPAFGEIAMRGLPRYLGADLSQRVGMENLIMPFGEPKSMKPQDLMAYGAQALGGAPLSLLSEYPRGFKALVDGDIVEASKYLVPLKAYSDAVTAYQRATVGKQTPSGRQSLSPYTPVEAATKALGFTPGRDAETGEMRAALQGDQARFRAERGKVVKDWVTATPNDKTAAWGAVQRWNAGQPENAHIKMKELTADVARRKREETSPDHADAVATSRRDRHLREAGQIYNLSR